MEDFIMKYHYCCKLRSHKDVNYSQQYASRDDLLHLCCHLNLLCRDQQMWLFNLLMP